MKTGHLILLGAVMSTLGCKTAGITAHVTVQPVLFGPVHAIDGPLRPPLGERVSGMHIKGTHESMGTGGADGSSSGRSRQSGLLEMDYSILLITDGDHRRWLVVHDLKCSGKGMFIIFAATSKGECVATGTQYQPPPVLYGDSSVTTAPDVARPDVAKPAAIKASKPDHDDVLGAKTKSPLD